MKIQANNIRPGMVIEHDGRPWSVMKIQTTQPGKGGAYIQVEMRGVDTGIKTNVRWRTSESVEKLDVRQVRCSYLFRDDAGYVFMDQQTFDQFTLATDLVGEKERFLQDGMEVLVDVIEGTPISVALPPTVVLEVVDCEPVVKGQTAASSYKPAVANNGVRVMVPPHVDTGTKIVVNTADASYVERFKG